MIKYKMVVSDFDGTLSYDNKISKNNLNAINDFISKGGIFTICTGRATCGIKPELESVGYKGYFASYNGANVEDMLTGKTIYKNAISNEIALRCVKLTEKLGVNTHIYPNDVLTINKYNDYTKFYLTFNKISYNEVGLLSDYLLKTGYDTYKILLIDDKEKISASFPVLKDSLPECNVIHATDIMIEITLKGVSKASALQILAELHGVDINETIAIGDAGNDVPMIQTAGLGIAMGNASNEVKSKADYVAPSVENDAIKHVIEKFCI